MTKFLAVDCESTGVHKECNILTVSMVAFRRPGEILGELDLKILPPDGKTFSVDPQAMEVNKIDLAQHLLEAEPLSKCQNKIKNFLHQHTHSIDPGWDGVGDIQGWIRRDRLIVVGSQVHGDMRWIEDKVFPNIKTYVSHKLQDTVCIAEFLKHSGKLNVESTGLESLALHFGIQYTPHIAIEDCRGAAQVFIKMLELNEC